MHTMIFPAPQKICWQEGRFAWRCEKAFLVPALGQQEYKITNDAAGLIIEYGSQAALWYARATLQQIKMQNKKNCSAFYIHDKPMLRKRAFMLDISRSKVPRVGELRKIIDLLALFKYNQLQLYVEHSFAFKKHQKVWQNVSPLTGMDIKKLDEYCVSKGIELVPNLNSFGHLENWLKHPEYKHLANSPDGFEIPEKNYSCKQGSVLYPSVESLNFISELYSEYLPHFTSNYFNIGCDEVWQLEYGRAKTQCRARGSHNVYFDFVNELVKMAAKHGKTSMLWADVILKNIAMAKKISHCPQLLVWGYEANDNFMPDCEKLKTLDIPFYVCPGTSSWNSLGGRLNNCLQNISNAVKAARKYNSEGLILTDWGDNEHLQYWPISYPGIIAAAQGSWRGKNITEEQIISVINTFINPVNKIGKDIINLGKLPEFFATQYHNRTSYAWAFIHNLKSFAESTPEISPNEVHNCLEHLGTIKPEDQELKNTKRMIWCGLQKMLLAAGNKVDLKTLRRNYSKINLRHHELWLKRNRTGGLNNIKM